MSASAVLTAPPETELVLFDRTDFAFSRNGLHGVCRTTLDAEPALEHWALESEQPSCQPISGVSITPETSALPLDDGRIVLVRRGEPSTAPHELVLLHPREDGEFRVARWGEIPSALGGYLLPSPSSAQLAFYVALEDSGGSTIWRLSASVPRVEPLAHVPGSMSGGVWLDGHGDLLALNQFTDSHRTSGIVIDLGDGSWRRIWSMSARSTDRIALYSPQSKVLVVTTNAGGEERLGLVHLGGADVAFPENLQRPGYPRRALAFDGRGERLLVDEVAGAVSRLFIYTPAAQRVTALAGSPGSIFSPASWAGDLVRFRFSAPSQPPTLATVRVAPQPRWSVSHDGELETETGWADAELVELPGSTGSMETIVYGGPGWRQSRHLVLALHGGPLASWRFEFDLLFQCLVAAGVAVVAPNYRGSTGYGTEHQRAAIGNWGGPDLDDVLHLGRDLSSERARHGLAAPAVLGASYGAYLALLAAGTAPELWSSCVALAPFLSGPSLYDNGDAEVRRRVETLGGLKNGDDAAGPHDVLRVCPALSAPLLLVHGTNDLTIPVCQSRMLVRRLLELGRIEGADFDYVEVDSDHREVALAQRAALRQRIVRFCHTQPRLRGGGSTTGGRSKQHQSLATEG
ncbi:MAG: alpha/beta hydrolase family protein [Pseudonocardia sp.]